MLNINSIQSIEEIKIEVKKTVLQTKEVSAAVRIFNYDDDDLNRSSNKQWRGRKTMWTVAKRKIAIEEIE